MNPPGSEKLFSHFNQRVMKTLSYFIFLGWLFFLLGCVKEESAVQSTAKPAQQVSTTTNIMRLDLRDAANGKVQVQIPVLSLNPNLYVEPRVSSNHTANGHSSPIEGYPSSFSAAQNNGGTHGSALIRLPWAGIHLDIECLIVEDNVAVLEGLITQVFYDYCDGCMVPGQYFTFEIIDNGEGQNAPVDQVGAYVYWSDEPLCGMLPPNSPDWGPLWDVLGQGDQIQVK